MASLLLCQGTTSLPYQIKAADELLPTLRAALDDDGVSVINCPVDYRENLRLIERLGQLDTAL